MGDVCGVIYGFYEACIRVMQRSSGGYRGVIWGYIGVI